jgi:hypothetical protein
MKVKLRSELARGFNIPYRNTLLNLVDSWINHLSGQNLNELDRNEFISDIENIKAFAKILQGWVKNL